MSETSTHVRTQQLRALARSLAALVRDVLSRYSRLGGSQFAGGDLVPGAVLPRSPRDVRGDDPRRGPVVEQRRPATDLVSAIAEQLGLSTDGTARLDALVRAVPPPWSLAGLAALGLALWGATGVMYSIQKALAVVFEGGASRGLIRGRLVSALPAPCLSSAHLVLSCWRCSSRCSRTSFGK